MALGRAQRDDNTSGSHPLAGDRVRLFLVVMTMLMIGITLKLFNVQFLKRGYFLEVDAHLHRGPNPEKPVPGGIYSRGLEPMAVSVPRETIYANPTRINNSDKVDVPTTAREISRLTGLDPDLLRKRLKLGVKAKRQSWPLVRLLKRETVVALNDDPPPHVWTEREYKRVYPGGKLACHVLGRRSSWHEALEGAELQWDFLLSGRPGTRPHNVDAYGRSILGADASGVLPPEPGKNLVLTIDIGIQEVVELALDECMKRFEPKAATCTVMDPRTGELLALASRPNFNPAGIEGGTKDEISARLSNVPVVRQYEPGSLFKVLLAAATLESDAYTGSEAYYCDGFTEDLGGRPLRCWDPRGHGTCNLMEMVAQSCNIAAARFALLIGADHYYKFLRNLGLGSRMGIGLPGERPGSLRPPDKMRMRDLANLGFGQGVSVTDIQMLSAVCSVVNGGTVVKPQIARAVLDPKTNRPIRELEPRAKGIACSAETSARVGEMMEAVVDHGTGGLAAIEGVRVGGKTGTAQKWIEEEGGFVEGRNIVSFVMVAPLEDPRFAILVTADEPALGEHGADVAAPAARRVAVAALRQAGLLSEQVDTTGDAGV